MEWAMSSMRKPVARLHHSGGELGAMSETQHLFLLLQLFVCLLYVVIFHRIAQNTNATSRIFIFVTQMVKFCSVIDCLTPRVVATCLSRWHCTWATGRAGVG